MTLAVRTGPFRAMELEARGLPRQAAGRHQPPRHRLEIRHGLFVVHLVDRRRQDLFPVIHQAMILLKPRGDVIAVVGPADTTEVGHPARDGHVAQVAAAVDEHARSETGATAGRGTCSCRASCRRSADCGRRRWPSGARDAARPGGRSPGRSRKRMQSRGAIGCGPASRESPRTSAGPARNSPAP